MQNDVKQELGTNFIELGEDEYWGYWWKCSVCGEANIAHSNYCCGCGRKFIAAVQSNDALDQVKEE